MRTWSWRNHHPSPESYDHEHHDHTTASTIDITEHFSDEDWDAGNGPLSREFLDQHGLEDETYDERWFSQCFEFDGHRLGCYLDSAGQYWIAYYAEAQQAYQLERIGNEEDLIDHLGIELDQESED